MGVQFPALPGGTFYAFGSVAALGEPLNDGVAFMQAGFEHRVLTVPGEYFDVNPNRARTGASPLAAEMDWVRLLAAVDVVFLIISYLVFDFVMET